MSQEKPAPGLGTEKVLTFQIDEDPDDEYQEDQFEIGKRLGRGSFATVYVAKHITTDRKVVVKKLDRIQKDQEEQVQNEIDMMKKARGHPNLVSYKGHYRTTDNILCIVMGYCEGGTLADLLKNMDSGVYLTEEQIMGWFIQLVMAVNHLHEKNIIHRDLKPGNIFFNKNHTVMRVGDLGIAKSMNGSEEMNTTLMGTPYYMSPELMANQPYSTKSDIWSLGCILYEMAARKTAFDAKGMPQLIMKIMRNAYQPLPSYLSRQFTGLVGSMLRTDPDVRPAACQLLQLSFVRMHAEKQLEQPINPQIDAALSLLVESPEDAGADRRVERPYTAVRSTFTSRPKTGKSVKSNGRRGKGPRAKTGKSRKSDPNLQTVKVHHVSAKEWDAGAQYEHRQAQMREMRHQAREMEQRMGREVARQRRKATDPQERAKEERKQRQLRAMLKEKERRKIAEQEAAILKAVIGKDVGAQRAGMGSLTFDKLGRTMPGLPIGDEDEEDTRYDQENGSTPQQDHLETQPEYAGGESGEAAADERKLPEPTTGAALKIRDLLEKLDDENASAGPSEDEADARGNMTDGGYSSDGRGIRHAEDGPGDVGEVDDADVQEDEDERDDDDDSDVDVDEDDEDEDDDDEDDEDDDEDDEDGEDEDDVIAESEEVMETKLAEVWESNPIERMKILERVWQQSMRTMSKKAMEAQEAEDSPDASGRGPLPAPSDPTQLLGNLGNFFVHNEGAPEDMLGHVQGRPRSGQLPPLRNSPRHSCSAAEGGNVVVLKSALKSRTDADRSVHRYPSPPGSASGRGHRHSSDDVGTALEVQRAAEHARVPEIPPEDPLLQAASLRRILTSTHRADGDPELGGPGPHPLASLAPLEKSSRHGKWSTNTSLGAPILSHGSPDPVPKPSTPSMTATQQLKFQTEGLEAGKELKNAAKGISDPKSKSQKRNKSMMGDFFKAATAGTVKNLESDHLLGPEESADLLGAMVLDTSMPEKLMALEQKHRIVAGDPLFRPSWAPEPRPPKEDVDNGMEPEERGVSFSVIPDATPSKTRGQLPELRDKPKRSVQIVEPPASSGADHHPNSDDIVNAEALMFSAVQDQMREIRRWRETLVSGRQSHELAALELMDRAASIHGKSANKSHTSSLRSVMSKSNDAGDDSSESDDEVINL